MVDNDEWLDGLEYVPFLRDVGRHFTINRMLTFDSVKLRLDREQPLTFLEFNYMILQAYDFLELSRRAGCRLQMGGSDQWGNIVNGIELARRIDGTEVFGVTTPLITTADGAKMGKTAKGAVWLNAEQLSPYDYWQFWRNTQDADVGTLPAAVHRSAARRDRAAGERWRRGDQRCQDGLATAATAMIHGERRRERPSRRRGRRSRGAARERTCRALPPATACPIVSMPDRARLRRFEGRGAAQDRRRRGACERCGREGPAGPDRDRR